MENKHFRILIVDDEQQYRDVLQMILQGEGFTVDTADSGANALKKLQRKHYHLVLSDLIMGEMDGLALLEAIQVRHPSTAVIIVTGYGSVKNAVDAMKRGAYTYFIKSHDPDELLLDIEKLMELTALKAQQAAHLSTQATNVMLSTRNESFAETLRIVTAAATSNANILLLGESGVGKEVIANYIHQHSPRSQQAFVPVNCHAISETLLESELFGHEKGAFTGATDQRIGRFEAAHDGTLFLDEVGDMAMSTQVKLLRAFESRSIERLGSNQSIPVDFRLISATHQNLQEMVRSGTFREDFYYRISTISVVIPPLRDRREDLKELIHFFVRHAQQEMKKDIRDIEPAAMDFLMHYDYPGNIRELKNMIERLVVLSSDGILRKRDIAPHQRQTALSHTGADQLTLKEFRSQAERKFIEQMLQKHNFNMTETSKALGISRRQLFNKITEYDIDKQPT